MTALCTVQGEEAYKALVAAQRMASYRRHREQILRARRLSWKIRLSSWKSSACARGMRFAISDPQAIEMMFSPCTYCGRQPVQGTDPPGSIDRADNRARAYTVDTAVPCCIPCNMAKGCLCPVSYIGHAITVSNWPTPGAAGPSPKLRLPASLPSSYAEYKASAGARGYDFRLSEDEFAQWTAQDCAFCGRPGPNGVDRKDNLPVYSNDTVQACCTLCNCMKSDQPDQVFRDRCAAIAELDVRQRFQNIPECQRRIVTGTAAARLVLSNSEEARAAANAGAPRMLDDGRRHTLLCHKLRFRARLCELPSCSSPCSLP
jgi:hypothetical protein